MRKTFILLFILSGHSWSSQAQRDSTYILDPIGTEAFTVMCQNFNYDQDIPLDALIVERIEEAEYVREKVVFRGIRDNRVPAYLAIPKKGTGPYPCVLQLHGLDGSKSDWWVEDNWISGGQISKQLLAAGYAVLAADDGISALRIVDESQPDLIILDLGLPGMDGLDVCRELRKKSDLPIIILTARGEESDKLVGLELGADDYITKPFSPKELVARVRAVLRRMEKSTFDEEIFRVGKVWFDVLKMRLTIDDTAIELTPTEFELLLTLARQPGRIFTRSQLLDAIHGVAFESYERAIDAHIKNIRRKIEPDPRQPKYVLTVYGVGYKFNDVA